MRVGTKKAFGIDISKNAVSFAELWEVNGQIKIVRAGFMPLDPAIVSDGVVQDPMALAGALKQLKIAGSFKHSNAVLTICAEPVLLQILDLPDLAPGETKKFIQNEVRQYAVLPLKNVGMDYCGLRSSGAQIKRVLVGAAQTEHLSMTVKVIEKDNINTSAIEPAVAAFIRICYDKTIKSQKEKNVILLLIRDDVLNLCVFEKQRLEFLRTKKFEADITTSRQRSKWLKCEIESIIRFYELEKEMKVRGWQMFVACCPENEYSAKIAGEIKKQIRRRDIEIAAFENSLTDIVVDGNDDCRIPPVAAGAAMKLLNEGSSGIKLNLLPKEIISIEKSRKERLIIANITACLLVLLFLHNVFLSRKSIEVNRDIHSEEQKHLTAGMFELVESKRDVNNKIKLMENNLIEISQVVKNAKWCNWGRLLSELVNVAPQTVLVRNIRGDNGNTMKIDGLAVNFEAVNSFVGLLEQSRQISSVTLASAGQGTKSGKGLVNYSIVCNLAVSDLGSMPASPARLDSASSRGRTKRGEPSRDGKE